VIRLTPNLAIPQSEIQIESVRAQGPGGQHVNKVSSAVHLRFDIRASSLPEDVKGRLLHLRDRRITRDGVIVIKAQRHRTRERNRAEALERLAELVRGVLHPPKRRIRTRPTAAARHRRMEAKRRRGRIKVLRRRPSPTE